MAHFSKSQMQLRRSFRAMDTFGTNEWTPSKSNLKSVMSEMKFLYTNAKSTFDKGKQMTRRQTINLVNTIIRRKRLDIHSKELFMDNVLRYLPCSRLRNLSCISK